MFLFPKRLHSAQRTERTQKRLILFSLVGIFLIAGTVAALSWVSYRKEVAIASIRVSGAEAVSLKDIRGVADAELSGAYLKLFNRANGFLYPRKGIEKKLSEAFPRLASVSVSRISFKAIEVKVRERVPAYLWCGENLPLENARRECYFLDPGGVAFARAPYFSGNVYFEFYGKMNGSALRAASEAKPLAARGIEPPVGLSFLSPDEFARIVAFKDALRESGMPAEKFVVEESGDAFFLFPSGLRLKFLLTQDFDAVLFNLLAALDTEPLREEFFRSVEENPYEFLDARFENRIFYK